MKSAFTQRVRWVAIVPLISLIFLRPAAQTMTFTSCACESGFTLTGWGHDAPTGVIFPSEPNVNGIATIERNTHCWNAVSFVTRPFVNNNPPGEGTWKVYSNRGDEKLFTITNTSQVISLGWNNIRWFKMQLITTGPSGSNPNQTFDFDDFIYTIPMLTGAETPNLALSANPVCPGASVTLNITGNLHDANQWNIYSEACGTNLIGSTQGSSFMVNPNVNTTYFVRGVDTNGCVDPGPCSSIPLTIKSYSTALDTIIATLDPMPSINVTLTSSGGIDGTGALVQWYDGMNGAGNLLGSGLSMIVTPLSVHNYYARREGDCNVTGDQSIHVCLDALIISPQYLASDPHVSIFDAAISLSAQGIVTTANSENLEFNAGTTIELMPTFEVETGAQLLLQIKTCP